MLSEVSNTSVQRSNLLRLTQKRHVFLNSLSRALEDLGDQLDSVDDQQVRFAPFSFVTCFVST